MPFVLLWGITSLTSLNFSLNSPTQSKFFTPITHKMKQTSRLLKGLSISMPKAEMPIYKPLSLDSVSAQQLPNNTFDTQRLYAIKQTKFGHWPVYKKIQNTKITTEIKRVEGNVKLFADELSELMKNEGILPQNVKVNTLTGEVNIKGDHVSSIKGLLDKHL